MLQTRKKDDDQQAAANISVHELTDKVSQDCEEIQTSDKYVDERTVKVVKKICERVQHEVGVAKLDKPRMFNVMDRKLSDAALLENCSVNEKPAKKHDTLGINTAREKYGVDIRPCTGIGTTAIHGKLDTSTASKYFEKVLSQGIGLVIQNKCGGPNQIGTGTDITNSGIGLLGTSYSAIPITLVSNHGRLDAIKAEENFIGEYTPGNGVPLHKCDGDVMQNCDGNRSTLLKNNGGIQLDYFSDFSKESISKKSGQQCTASVTALPSCSLKRTVQNGETVHPEHNPKLLKMSVENYPALMKNAVKVKLTSSSQILLKKSPEKGKRFLQKSLEKYSFPFVKKIDSFKKNKMDIGSLSKQNTVNSVSENVSSKSIIGDSNLVDDVRKLLPESWEVSDTSIFADHSYEKNIRMPVPSVMLKTEGTLSVTPKKCAVIVPCVDSDSSESKAKPYISSTAMEHNDNVTKSGSCLATTAHNDMTTKQDTCSATVERSIKKTDASSATMRHNSASDIVMNKSPQCGSRNSDNSINSELFLQSSIKSLSQKDKEICTNTNIDTASAKKMATDGSSAQISPMESIAWEKSSDSDRTTWSTGSATANCVTGEVLMNTGPVSSVENTVKEKSKNLLTSAKKMKSKRKSMPVKFDFNDDKKPKIFLTRKQFRKIPASVLKNLTLQKYANHVNRTESADSCDVTDDDEVDNNTTIKKFSDDSYDQANSMDKLVKSKLMSNDKNDHKYSLPIVSTAEINIKPKHNRTDIKSDASGSSRHNNSFVWKNKMDQDSSMLSTSRNAQSVCTKSQPNDITMSKEKCTDIINNTTSLVCKNKKGESSDSSLSETVHIASPKSCSDSAEDKASNSKVSVETCTTIGKSLNKNDCDSLKRTAVNDKLIKKPGNTALETTSPSSVVKGLKTTSREVCDPNGGKQVKKIRVNKSTVKVKKDVTVVKVTPTNLEKIFDASQEKKNSIKGTTNGDNVLFKTCVNSNLAGLSKRSKSYHVGENFNSFIKPCLKDLRVTISPIESLSFNFKKNTEICPIKSLSKPRRKIQRSREEKQRKIVFRKTKNERNKSAIRTVAGVSNKRASRKRVNKTPPSGQCENSQKKQLVHDLKDQKNNILTPFRYKQKLSNIRMTFEPGVTTCCFCHLPANHLLGLGDLFGPYRPLAEEVIARQDSINEHLKMDPIGSMNDTAHSANGSPQVTIDTEKSSCFLTSRVEEDSTYVLGSNVKDISKAIEKSSHRLRTISAIEHVLQDENNVAWQRKQKLIPNVGKNSTVRIPGPKNECLLLPGHNFNPENDPKKSQNDGVVPNINSIVFLEPKINLPHSDSTMGSSPQQPLGQGSPQRTSPSISERRSSNQSKGGVKTSPLSPSFRENRNKLSGDSTCICISHGFSTKPLWVHGNCAVWADGVYAIRGQLYGLWDATRTSSQILCTFCSQPGATIVTKEDSIKSKVNGVPLKAFHYPCSIAANLKLNWENLTSDYS